MLSFLKKFFGAKPTASTPEVPYKVETPPTTVGTVPMSTQYAESATAPKKKPAARRPAGAKKPAVQAKTARTKKQAS